MLAGQFRIERLEAWLLALVLAVAIVLRLWGAYFGLPYIYHVDEGFEVYRAMRLGTGSLDLGGWGKGGYFFILFAEYAVYFVVMLVTGAVSGPWDFAMHFVSDPAPFWKIGRVTTAVAGAFTVLIVWWQGRKVAGPVAGLLAAWFLAWSFLHVRDSHFIAVDVPMTLFTFWALVMIAEDAAGRRKLNPYLFAPVAAFAIACKFPAVVLALPYVLASLFRGGLRGERGLLTRATLLPGVATVVIYLLLNPNILFHLSAAMTLVSGQAIDLAEFAEIERPNLWSFYGSALLESQGVALLAAAAAGVVLALSRHRKVAIIHLAFLLPYFIGIAASETSQFYYYRYAIPLLPGLCLFAGIAVAAAVERIRSRWIMAAAGCLAAAALVIEPGISAIRYDRDLVRDDTRTRTVEWFERTVPPGASVLLEGFPEADSELSVPLKNTKANIAKMVERLRETDPGKAQYWELRLKTHTPPGYDLVTVRFQEAWGALPEYRAAGVNYVVLRRNRFVPGGSTAGRQKEWIESRRAFYRDLAVDGVGELVATFDPERDGLRGPLIEVWRLTP